MVRFFADECVARSIVGGRRGRGLDVVDAKDVCQGESDDRALSLAAAAGRVVITDDHGFGELAVRHRPPAVGVIILSLFQLPAGRRELMSSSILPCSLIGSTGTSSSLSPDGCASGHCPHVT